MYAYIDPAFDRLSANLVHEMCFFLQEYGTFEAMEKFLDVVPEQHRGLDAYLTMKSKVPFFVILVFFVFVVFVVFLPFYDMSYGDF